jgi:small subunit ribosomal protein S17
MSEQQATTPAPAERTLTGTVVSSKMQKTVAVSIERLVKHDRYGKYVRRTSKVLAHDETSECREGDVVDIAECRRLSARKAWKVVRVVKRAGTV